MHEFNSAWWGGSAAVIDDPAFFTLPADEQRHALAPFEWAEFRCSAGAEPPARAVHEAGFMKVDTQVQFRIRLCDVSAGGNGGPAGVSVRSALEPEYSLDQNDWETFEHERFRHLPGVTSERLNARYSTWAEMLRANDPAHCFQVLHSGEPQGWFLGHAESSDTVNLTLGVLRRRATISGFTVYETALRRFSAMGYRIGTASFSISNTAVQNIYARLGARFTCPTGIWLWIRRWA